MGRTVRSKNYNKTPYVKPVEKVELSEKNLKGRIFLVVLLILIAAASFAYGVNSLLTKNAGWQEIHAISRSDTVNCSEDFVFLYNLGASGASATAEGKIITGLYTEVTERAYKLFHIKEGFENVNNIYYINHHPNEEIMVDEMLYKAFDLISQFDNRYIFLGPVYTLYDDIFYCTEDYQIYDFDPYLNPEIEAYYQEIADFAKNKEMIDIQLLGNNTIKLYVSQEYLSYAQENEIQEFIDFFWMKNAIIVDYIADLMISKGHNRGSISSYDGFIRNMDASEESYSFNIYHKNDEDLELVDIFEYNGPMSIVYYRNYKMNSLDDHHYYQLENGEMRTPYVDIKDGKARNSLNELYVYSKQKSCMELMLKTAELYIAEALDEERLLKLPGDEIQIIYFKNK